MAVEKTGMMAEERRIVAKKRWPMAFGFSQNPHDLGPEKSKLEPKPGRVACQI